MRAGRPRSQDAPARGVSGENPHRAHASCQHPPCRNPPSLPLPPESSPVQPPGEALRARGGDRRCRPASTVPADSADGALRTPRWHDGTKGSPDGRDDDGNDERGSGRSALRARIGRHALRGGGGEPEAPRRDVPGDQPAVAALYAGRRSAGSAGCRHPRPGRGRERTPRHPGRGHRRAGRADGPGARRPGTRTRPPPAGAVGLRSRLRGLLARPPGRQGAGLFVIALARELLAALRWCATTGSTPDGAALAGTETGWLGRRWRPGGRSGAAGPDGRDDAGPSGRRCRLGGSCSTGPRSQSRPMPTRPNGVVALVAEWCAEWGEAVRGMNPKKSESGFMSPSWARARGPGRASARAGRSAGSRSAGGHPGASVRARGAVRRARPRTRRGCGPRG